MGYSFGEFSGYTLGHWEDAIHWEFTGGMIRLWSSDELTSLVVLMDLTEARKALRQLEFLVEMMEAN